MPGFQANPKVIRVEAWKRFPWLWHGFATRRGGVSTIYGALSSFGGKEQQLDAGDLNLGWTKEDNPSSVTENRRRFVSAAAGAADYAVPLVTVRQTHSSTTLRVSPAAGGDISAFVSADGRALNEADGLMTNAGGLLLGIQTADCVPVLVADTRLRVVAAFHAGWRGTMARIVETGVAQMLAEYGSSANDLIAAIGPSIGPCCYSVGDEVHGAFSEGFGYAETLFSPSDPSEAKQLHLNLWEANRRQLMEAGVPAHRIETLKECTGCAGLPGLRRYFSHRRENGFTGRMLSVIGIAEHPSVELLK